MLGQRHKHGCRCLPPCLSRPSCCPLIHQLQAGKPPAPRPKETPRKPSAFDSADDSHPESTSGLSKPADAMQKNHSSHTLYMSRHTRRRRTHQHQAKRMCAGCHVLDSTTGRTACDAASCNAPQAAAAAARSSLTSGRGSCLRTQHAAWSPSEPAGGGAAP